MDPPKKGEWSCQRAFYTPQKPPDGIIYIHLGLSVFSLQSIFLSYRNQGGEYLKETLKFWVSDVWYISLELTNRNRSAPFKIKYQVVCAAVCCLKYYMSEQRSYVILF